MLGLYVGYLNIFVRITDLVRHKERKVQLVF